VSIATTLIVNRYDMVWDWIRRLNHGCYVTTGASFFPLDVTLRSAKQVSLLEIVCSFPAGSAADGKIDDDAASKLRENRLNSTKWCRIRLFHLTNREKDTLGVVR